MLQRCDALIILTLEGWRASQGVQAEIYFAEQLQLPIEHHEPSAAIITKGVIACR